MQLDAVRHQSRLLSLRPDWPHLDAAVLAKRDPRGPLDRPRPWAAATRWHRCGSAACRASVLRTHPFVLGGVRQVVERRWLGSTGVLENRRENDTLATQPRNHAVLRSFPPGRVGL